MAKKSNFEAKRGGHAGLNPSERLATAETWQRLHELSHTPAPIVDSRADMAPPSPQIQGPAQRVWRDLPPRLSGTAFIEKCVEESPNVSTRLNYARFWKSELDKLLAQALQSQPVQDIIDAKTNAAMAFAPALLDQLQSLTTAANRPLVSGTGTTHGFMLNHDGGLKREIVHEVKNYAASCLRGYFADDRITETKAMGEFGNPQFKRQFIDHCGQLALHSELPDAKTNPERTKAMRAALRHAIYDIAGIARYNLDDPQFAEAFTAKLNKKIIINAISHITRHPNPFMDYQGLIGGTGKELAPDVMQFVEQFARYSITSFDGRNEIPLSTAKSANQR